MKLWLYGFAMCQSMFCALPFPWNLWEEKARDKMLLCLPFVGLEVGFLWYGCAWLCGLLKLPDLVSGLAVCVLPYLLTGYIHLDGFMDVTDAVKSWRSLERRREILKDSHVGSFAVIAVVLLMLAQFAFAVTAVSGADLRGLILIPAATRCCAAAAVIGLPPMTTSQYAGTEKTVGKLAFPLTLLACTAAMGFLLSVREGTGVLAAAAGYGLALRRAYRSLEGMNGDISGYALTLGELCGLAVLALV